jgi:hypothetical protein
VSFAAPAVLRTRRWAEAEGREGAGTSNSRFSQVNLGKARFELIWIDGFIFRFSSGRCCYKRTVSATIGRVPAQQSRDNWVSDTGSDKTHRFAGTISRR